MHICAMTPCAVRFSASKRRRALGPQRQSFSVPHSLHIGLSSSRVRHCKFKRSGCCSNLVLELVKFAFVSDCCRSRTKAHTNLSRYEQTSSMRKARSAWVAYVTHFSMTFDANLCCDRHRIRPRTAAINTDLISALPCSVK